MQSSDTVVRLLQACREGDAAAYDQLVTLVYDDLRRIAHQQLRRGQTKQRLATTGLVHEVYLRMLDPSRLQVKDRGHFYAVVARAMRQVIVDFARRRRAAKRGGGEARIALEGIDVAVSEDVETLLAVDEALDRLAGFDERLVQVVEYRCFVGLSEEEIAQTLDISARTVRRDWLRAKAWLGEELSVVPRHGG